MSVSITDTDKGWRKVMNNMIKMDEAYVKVGYWEKSGAGKNGTPMAAIASFQEFGTSRGIPPRPFMKMSFDESLARIQAAVATEAGSIIDMAQTPKGALSVIGEWFKGQVQKMISSGIAPENAPATIARKGSSTTLIDTGAMRQSVVWEVVGA